MLVDEQDLKTLTKENMWLVNLEHIRKYIEEYIEYIKSIRKYLEEEPNGLAEDEDKNKSQKNKTPFWVGWRLPFWCKTGDHFRSLICVYALFYYFPEVTWIIVILMFKIFIPSPHKSVSGGVEFGSESAALYNKCPVCQTIVCWSVYPQHSKSCSPSVLSSCFLCQQKEWEQTKVWMKNNLHNTVIQLWFMAYRVVQVT